jgi:NAD(P)-dependent dehydrogenase (short-subunit alcohol dehydrogenase family)
MHESLRQLFSLQGQVALVTGGSRGLGLQIATALGDAGAKIMLTSRKAGDLEEAAAELRERGIDVRFFAADASDPAAAKVVVDATIGAFGRLDVLVNNAGATWGAPAEDHPVDAWDKVMNLNARSLFTFSQAAGREWMIPNRSGRIINVASVAGLGGNPPAMTTVAYNASKAAAINFTRALAGEWGRHGINVNAIAPGFFPTKMTKGLLGEWGDENVKKHSPLGRLGGDEDLKGAALLLATAAGNHITGQVIVVDGGASAIVGG